MPEKSRKKLNLEENNGTIRILEPEKRKEAFVKGYLKEFFIKNKNI
jgi:hypothetical protein